jgi:hypothetical protein
MLDDRLDQHAVAHAPNSGYTGGRLHCGLALMLVLDGARQDDVAVFDSGVDATGIANAARRELKGHALLNQTVFATFTGHVTFLGLETEN